MTVLSLSFTLQFAINIAIFCIITLLVCAINFRLLSVYGEDPGILEIMACISWVLSMILFCCVTETSLATSRSTMICGLIAGVTAYSLFLMHIIVVLARNLPDKIRQSRENRKAKMTKIEIKVKSNILDL